MRCERSILESEFVDQLKPMDLLALQADWVDDYCPEEEGLEEHKLEGKYEKNVEDEKMDFERFSTSSIYSRLDGPDEPA